MLICLSSRILHSITSNEIVVEFPFVRDIDVPFFLHYGCPDCLGLGGDFRMFVDLVYYIYI